MADYGERELALMDPRDVADLQRLNEKSGGLPPFFSLTPPQVGSILPLLDPRWVRLLPSRPQAGPGWSAVTPVTVLPAASGGAVWVHGWRPMGVRYELVSVVDLSPWFGAEVRIPGPKEGAPGRSALGFHPQGTPGAPLRSDQMVPWMRCLLALPPGSVKRVADRVLPAYAGGRACLDCGGLVGPFTAPVQEVAPANILEKLSCECGASPEEAPPISVWDLPLRISLRGAGPKAVLLADGWVNSPRRGANPLPPIAAMPVLGRVPALDLCGKDSWILPEDYACAS